MLWEAIFGEVLLAGFLVRPVSKWPNPRTDPLLKYGTVHFWSTRVWSRPSVAHELNYYSLAHWEGLQPYTDEITARGNIVSDFGGQAIEPSHFFLDFCHADVWRRQS